MTRVVILMQENKTPDYYFPTLTLWGADIQNKGNLLSAPPTPDPSHDRNAWVVVVNGFHDTANAVATVIYTHSLPAHLAVKTVVDNCYQPLSRPMFVYVSRSAARREAKAFARFCVDPENARYVRDVGYVPLPAVTLLAATRRLDYGVTGSIFAGRGSVLGVTADTFQDEDRIQNALVQ